MRDNTKTSFREMGCEDGKWMELPQDRDVLLAELILWVITTVNTVNILHQKWAVLTFHYTWFVFGRH